MRVLIDNIIDGSSSNISVPRGMNPVRIGLDRRNAVILPSNYVPAEAAAFANDGNGWSFWSLCPGRWTVAGKRLKDRETISWSEGQTYRFENLFSISFFLEAHDKESPKDQLHRWNEAYSESLREIHRELNKQMNDERAKETERENQLAEDFIVRLEQRIEELVTGRADLPRDEFSQTDLGNYVAGAALSAEITHRIIENHGGGNSSGLSTNDAWRPLRTFSPVRERELDRLLERTVQDLQLKLDGDLTEQLSRLEHCFWDWWAEYSSKASTSLRRYLVHRRLKKEIKDIWYGYGPLEDLLANPTVKEIMVNDKDHIFIEHNNVIENSGRRFISEEVTRSIIEKIVSRAGRRIDASEPLVDARLSDGSRVNAVIPPLAIKGPCLTIRRFPKKRLEAADLVRFGSLSEPAQRFLQAAVLDRRNVLVAGGTGTGKTTLLNCLSGFIPDKERIVTIEDTAELRLHKEHVVTLEVKQKNAEGRGAVTIRDLVRNSLRMRPDRIVVGECRGPEALDMLQAMNTGHDGSMTTLHANTPQDVILRLEVLANMGEEKLPTDSIRRQIASAVDLICQLKVVKRGEKKYKVVSEIAEVAGVDPDGNVRVVPIFSRKDDHADLLPTGFLPTFVNRLIEDELLDLDSLLI